eukprot:9571879-Alexandrium_andersonii.AAC.1
MYLSTFLCRSPAVNYGAQACIRCRRELVHNPVGVGARVRELSKTGCVSTRHGLEHALMALT